MKIKFILSLLLLFVGVSIFVGCKKTNNRNTTTLENVLSDKFGIIKIEKDVKVNLQSFKGLNLDSDFKELANLSFADNVLYYFDGSKAFIFNSNDSEKEYVLKISSENKLLAEKYIIQSGVNNTESSLNFNVKIVEANGNTTDYSVKNNAVTNMTLAEKPTRLPGESFDDCFKRSLNTLTDDWVGIVAFAANPAICLSACALSCA